MRTSIPRAPTDVVGGSSIAESQMGVGEEIGGIAKGLVVGIESLGKEECALVGTIVEMVVDGLP